MAKGSICIQFESMADLLEQIALLVSGTHVCALKETRKALCHPIVGMAERPAGAAVSGGADFGAASNAIQAGKTPEGVSPRGVLGCVGTDMSAGSSAAPAAEPPAKEPVPAEPSQPESETAVSAAEVPSAAHQQEPSSESVDNTVTPENVGTVDYAVLLAFCERHPEIGVDASKCGPSYFRPLVEKRVTNYLNAR
jgi:hypothetical protein